MKVLCYKKVSDWYKISLMIGFAEKFSHCELHLSRLFFTAAKSATVVEFLQSYHQSCDASQVALNYLEMAALSAFHNAPKQRDELWKIQIAALRNAKRKVHQFFHLNTGNCFCRLTSFIQITIPIKSVTSSFLGKNEQLTATSHRPLFHHEFSHKNEDFRDQGNNFFQIEFWRAILQIFTIHFLLARSRWNQLPLSWPLCSKCNLLTLRWLDWVRGDPSGVRCAQSRRITAMCARTKYPCGTWALLFCFLLWRINLGPTQVCFQCASWKMWYMSSMMDEIFGNLIFIMRHVKWSCGLKSYLVTSICGSCLVACGLFQNYFPMSKLPSDFKNSKTKMRCVTRPFITFIYLPKAKLRLN